MFGFKNKCLAVWSGLLQIGREVFGTALLGVCWAGLRDYRYPFACLGWTWGLTEPSPPALTSPRTKTQQPHDLPHLLALPGSRSHPLAGFLTSSTTFSSPGLGLRNLKVD